MRVANETAALDQAGPGRRGETPFEIVLRLEFGARVRVMMERGVVEDHADALGRRELEQRGTEIGFVEVVGEQIELQRVVLVHAAEHLED